VGKNEGAEGKKLTAKNAKNAKSYPDGAIAAIRWGGKNMKSEWGRRIDDL